jgi:hypothetical protein
MSHELLGVAQAQVPSDLLVSSIRGKRIYVVQNNVKKALFSFDAAAPNTRFTWGTTLIWSTDVVSPAAGPFTQSQGHHGVSNFAIAQVGTTVVVDQTNINPSTTAKAVTSGTVTTVWDITVAGTIVTVNVTVNSSLPTPSIWVTVVPIIPIPPVGQEVIVP